jgi:glycosyltransferase involved in cell wall biosynthesis
MNLTIVRGVTAVEEADATTFAKLLGRGLLRSVARHALRYGAVRLIVPRLDALERPFATMGLLRLLSRGACSVVDLAGNRRDVTLARLVSSAAAWLRDRFALPALLRRTRSILASTATRGTLSVSTGRPWVLRTDLWFGVTSGGSVGHLAGVLNNLAELMTPPRFFTTDPIPTVTVAIDQEPLPLPTRFWDLLDAPSIAANIEQIPALRRALFSERPGFVYHRHSLNSYLGLAIARAAGVPLVLEYNGSEVWIARNWGRPLAYADIAETIELTVLLGAEVIVVVSQPMRDELVARGVEPDRVLVNPNGVDTDRYSPDVDGLATRNKLGFGDTVVVGFIGTFSVWHGAEVLASAFGKLMTANPSMVDRVRLLMIGDGPRLEASRAIIENAGLEAFASFVGRTRQEDGPGYLAACDILVSPHVPNADGSPFFGSPTKLFEYMAMGKAIVASDLDQIGEVLEDDRSSVLVPPGDPEALAKAISELVRDPERRSRLGAAAREAAVARHTWREHTRRIIEKVRSLDG